MDKKIFNNLEELNKSFTELLKGLLSEKERVTISLSGGSTPKSLFDYWAKNHVKDIEWNKIFLFWGDERCVPPTDEQSNYNMTKDHLLDFVPIPESNIFRIKGENEPEEEAIRYSAVLDKELDLRNNIPSFDLVILGMGDDGHTASIFPHEMHLWDKKENCVVAVHPDSGQKRVSITGKIINNAERVVMLVTGANKAEKVKLVIDSQDQVKDTYPTARVMPTSGNLYWYLDTEAARLLK